MYASRRYTIRLREAPPTNEDSRRTSNDHALSKTISDGQPWLPIFLAPGTIGSCPKDLSTNTAIPTDPSGALLLHPSEPLGPIVLSHPRRFSVQGHASDKHRKSGPHHLRESNGINSKRRGISSSTKQSRKAMRPSARSRLLLCGRGGGLLIFDLQLVHHLLHVGNG